MSQTVVFRKIYNNILEIFKENGYNIIVQNYVYINGVLQLTDKFPDVIVIKLQKGHDIGSIQATIGLEMNVKINNKPVSVEEFLLEIRKKNKIPKMLMTKKPKV